MQHHTRVHTCLQCVRLIESCAPSLSFAHLSSNLEVEFLPSVSFQENWHPRFSVLRIIGLYAMYCLFVTWLGFNQGDKAESFCNLYPFTGRQACMHRYTQDEEQAAEPCKTT